MMSRRGVPAVLYRPKGPLCEGSYAADPTVSRPPTPLRFRATLGEMKVLLLALLVLAPSASTKRWEPNGSVGSTIFMDRFTPSQALLALAPNQARSISTKYLAKDPGARLAASWERSRTVWLA